MSKKFRTRCYSTRRLAREFGGRVSANLGSFAKAGFRAIAFDYPVLDSPDIPPSKARLQQQTQSIPKSSMPRVWARPRPDRHSRWRADSIQLALEDPSRYSHVIILGTALAAAAADRRAQVGQGTKLYRLASTKRWREKEPTVEDARNSCKAEPSNIR